MKRGEIAANVSRGAFYLVLEKAAALVSGVAYFALLLRWLGPTKYGIMTLALSFAGLATVATGNFEEFLERFAAEYQAQGRFDTLRRAHHLALLLKLGLGAVAAVLLAALAPWLAHHFQMPELGALLPVLTLIVITDGLATTGRATLYGLQRFRWLCFLSVTFHLVKTVMVGALWGFKQGLIALAFGLSGLTLLHGLAMSLVPVWILSHALAPAPAGPAPAPARGGLLREMAAYCAPLLGARVSFLSGQNLSKVVLGKLFDATHLGYFSFAFQTMERFIELVATLPSALLPSLTQLVARAERERLRYVFDQAFRLIQLMACVLSFGVFVFARELTLLVGSPLFEPAVPLLRILALVPIARTAQRPLTMLFQALRRPGIVLALALLKFGVEFGCYFTLVPALGLAGAGWANLGGALISYLVALMLLARVVPEGAGERSRAVALNVALLLPLLGVALAIDRLVLPPAAALLRVALAPVGLLGVFALGLVTRYDLEKLASVPLGSAWLRRTRDGVVAGADRLARALEPRRAS
jgi:O-antigen/teichoic acid export membrane protein